MTGIRVNFLGIGRATLIDDTGDLQLIQVTEGAAGTGFADRVTDKVRRIAEFGIASVPPIDSEILVLYRSADRSRPIVVGTSHRPSRPKGLKPGDSGIYDVRGRHVLMTVDGIEIDAKGGPVKVVNATTVTIVASEKVRLETPTVETTGDFVSRADGTSISLNALHDAYAAHKHTLVQAGTAVSGGTDHPV